MSIQFEDAVVPDDLSTMPSSDLACQVCGTPLVYSGAGRKPKFCEEHKGRRGAASSASSPSRRSSADVEQACAVLEGYYGLLNMALRMVSRTAAEVWLENKEVLQQENRVILTGDKTLCRRVNALGQKGGTAMFVSAHATALFPVAIIAKAEIDQRAAVSRARREQEKAAADARRAAATGDGSQYGEGAQYM